jgi:hypothetical protein
MWNGKGVRRKMSDDDFWVGAFFGAVAFTVGAAAVNQFSNESYARGWNGEQIIRTFLFDILGQTNTGATVLVASFRNGQRDREVRLALDMQNRELQQVNKQVWQVSEELKRLEITVQKAAQPVLPAEKRQFLDDLYSIAQTGLSTKKKEPQRLSPYSV